MNPFEPDTLVKTLKLAKAGAQLLRAMKPLLRKIPWQATGHIAARAGALLMRSATFKTPRLKSRSSQFVTAVVLYLMAITAATQFMTAVSLSLDADRHLQLWRRLAGLSVAVVVVYVARVCHVEADDLRDQLSKDSLPLW